MSILTGVAQMWEVAGSAARAKELYQEVAGNVPDARSKAEACS